MTTHTITIKIEDSGDFTYCPSTLHAKTGDTVIWTSSVGPFAVSFMVRTPFPAVTFNSQPDTYGGHCIVATQVRQTAIGHNLYAVALAQLSQGSDGTVSAKVFLDAGCPDIVVSDQ